MNARRRKRGRALLARARRALALACVAAAPLAPSAAAPQAARTVKVTVLDAEGHAAPGVRVRFGCGYEWTPSSGPRQKLPPMPWAMTDVTGHAELERPQRADGAVVSLLGPGLVPPDPGDPLLVRLPPTGALRITLAGLRAERGTLVVEGVPEHDPSLHGREAIEVSGALGATVELRHVGLGGTWRLDFESERGAARVDVVGPKRPGEVVDVRLEVLPRPILTARLVDARGDPLRDVPVLLCAPDRAAALAPATRTDAEGRLAVALDPRSPDLDAAFLVREEVDRADTTPPRFGRGAVVARRPGPEPLLDGGVVLLAPLPVVAAGTVRDGTGEGLGFGLVRALPAATVGRSGGSGPTTLTPLDVRAALPFDHIAHAVCRSRAAGRFELRAAPGSLASQGGEWVLVATRVGRSASGGEPLRAGALDHEVLLAPRQGPGARRR